MMNRERLLEELTASKRRLDEMMTVVTEAIERTNNWMYTDTASEVHAANVVSARRALEDVQSIVNKIA